jgi:hypothetical protein
MPMVTADDDMWYPKYWLARLWLSHVDAPGQVHCYRARRVVVSGDVLRPYAEWPFVDHDRPDATVFATGVSGVIYPPPLLDCLRDGGSAFEACCPKNDDIWLHVTALRTGFLARQLAPEVAEFETMPFTQSVGLQVQNVGMSRNDVQAAATYQKRDILRLKMR